jgi:hypothetical protein
VSPKETEMREEGGQVRQKPIWSVFIFICRANTQKKLNCRQIFLKVFTDPFLAALFAEIV